MNKYLDVCELKESLEDFLSDPGYLVEEPADSLRVSELAGVLHGNSLAVFLHVHGGVSSDCPSMSRRELEVKLGSIAGHALAFICLLERSRKKREKEQEA